MNPKYPIYIISKGRYETRMTSKALEEMNVPYFIVIEPQEYDKYALVIDSDKILTLPFSDLGEGSIPARNWVWEHAISTDSKRHWILDDNIRCWFRYHNNEQSMLRAAEDFIDRYTNVAIAGFHYDYFIIRKEKYPPYYLNTRIYSNLLIKNDLN